MKASIIHLLLRLLPISFVAVSGKSMEPTLHDGVQVFVSPLPYVVFRPKKNDIVVCVEPRTKRILIKRISAVVSSGYMVTGDNASASTDSRVFGPLPRKAIVAKVIDAL